jgi:hypothetical protein
MDMRRIAGKQHSASAIAIDKPRIVGPSAGVFERCDTDIRAADTAQHGFDGLLIHHAATPLRLLLGVSPDKSQACEMTSDLGSSGLGSKDLGSRTMRARFVPPCGPRHPCHAARLRGSDGRGHAAAPQRLDSKRSDPSCLQDDARGGQTLQHQDARAAQGQLDGGQEPDRSCSHHHDIDRLFHVLNPNIY